MPVGETEAFLGRLDFDLAKFAVADEVGRGVGEGVEVRTLADCSGDGLGEAVGVQEGAASGGVCHLLHGGVFGGCVGGELLRSWRMACGIASVIARGGGAEDLRVEESAGVDGIDGDLAAGEQVDGVAKLFFGVCDCGEWVGEVAGGVGEDGDGKRAREPDEILAAGNAGEVLAELAHGVERVLGAELELEGLHLCVELAEIWRQRSRRLPRLPCHRPRCSGCHLRRLGRRAERRLCLSSRMQLP